MKNSYQGIFIPVRYQVKIWDIFQSEITIDQSLIQSKSDFFYLSNLQLGWRVFQYAYYYQQI